MYYARHPSRIHDVSLSVLLEESQLGRTIRGPFCLSLFFCHYSFILGITYVTYSSGMMLVSVVIDQVAIASYLAST